MSWQLLLEFLVSLAYGVLSADPDLQQRDLYRGVAGGGFAEEATTAVGCAVGLSIGKVGTVLALRRGANFRWMRRIRDHPEARWQFSDEVAKLVGPHDGASG